jgi:hypothetical protein
VDAAAGNQLAGLHETQGLFVVIHRIKLSHLGLLMHFIKLKLRTLLCLNNGMLFGTYVNFM